ncbi:MAG: 2-oxoacid:acceptor oxidoreductase family protein [Candidatus Aenigmatarchaeota archaeon]
MRLNILFGGKAGHGIDKVSSLTGKILSKLGYHTFSYRDYGSLIRGGHNFNVLSISDERIASHDKALDGILALDEATEEKHSEDLKEDGFLLKEDDFEDAKSYGKGYNMVFAGGLIKKLGFDFELLEDEIQEEFDKEKIIESNIEAARSGFESVEEKFSLERVGEELDTMTGSEAVAEGAIRSGMDVYLAYPMTPATPVLHILAGRQEENNYMTLQPESELSVINAGLGCAHTGAKTMIGSSGGGYDLMQESMAMQGVSEIPLVVYLSQRAGTGTGVPTYTAQGDLEVATKGSHSEFPRVTIAPGDPLEAIKATNEAFYFAENYRLLSVILSDKHLAESEFSFYGDVDLVEVGRNIDTEKKDGLYKQYEITEDGVSPRSVPGINIVKSTSYDHNEHGITVEDEEIVKGTTDNRLRKWETVEKEAKKFDQYKVHGEGDVVVVGWGSTKGAIIDAVKELDNVKFLQIIYLEPFPEETEEILREADKVLLAENNSTGLLGNLITEKTGFRIKDENKILKYAGRPFMSDELKEKIEARL